MTAATRARPDPFPSIRGPLLGTCFVFSFSNSIPGFPTEEFPPMNVLHLSYSLMCCELYFLRHPPPPPFSNQVLPFSPLVYALQLLGGQSGYVIGTLPSLLLRDPFFVLAQPRILPFLITSRPVCSNNGPDGALGSVNHPFLPPLGTPLRPCLALPFFPPSDDRQGRIFESPNSEFCAPSFFAPFLLHHPSLFHSCDGRS